MRLGFFSRCLIQGNRARGDPDREIVGKRGVTRGDLVLVHKWIDLSAFFMQTSSDAWDIAEVFKTYSYSRRKFPLLYITLQIVH